jgi:hypothetical protein
MTDFIVQLNSLTWNDERLGTRVSWLIARSPMRSTDEAPAWGLFHSGMNQSVAETSAIKGDPVWARKIPRSRAQAATGRTRSLDEYLKQR